MGTHLGKSQRDTYFSRSFTGLDTINAEEDFEEEQTAAATEIFHGFLAIGTLGTESIIDDKLTPRFSLSVDDIDEKETEIKEDEPKLINDKLENVQEAEPEDGDGDEISSETRNVSTGKASQCCIINLGTSTMESDGANGTGVIVCPMQTESSIEQPGATLPMRKEHRPSLEELLQKTKQADENTEMNSEMEKKQTGKQTRNSAVHLMKKFLKRRTINSLAKSFTTKSEGTSDSAKAEKKSHKVRKQIKDYFSRKVYPEDSLYGHHDYKSGKQQNKNKETYNLEPDGIDFRPSADDIIIYPQGVFSENNFGSESQSFFPLVLKECDDASANEFCKT